MIENRITKKGNALYYPCFTKVIVNFVMDKDPLIPRRNKVNWHYARDDPMFMTTNVILRNEDTQLYGTILPTELTNEDICNSKSYKEYYAIASGKIPPKTKASKKKADSDATTKQKPPTVPTEKEGNKDEKDSRSYRLETISERVVPDEGTGEKSDEDATYVEDQGNRRTEIPMPILTEEMIHNAEATSLIDIPVTAIAEPSFFAPTSRPPTPTPLFTQLQQPPILTPTTTPSSSLQNLPDFGSLFGFDYRLKALEDNFSEFKQTNQYAEALSSILGIVDQYLANKIKEAVDVAVQLKSDRIEEMI
ncbi:hypothetical protein Tco_1569127 [Tanacetum coccineum]|uniref:Uncharacterized protein n=1 Tax=Tanacetum coccineum TaxID=301880 RepID=A0ABQ4XWJ9_9ASTR